MCEQQEAEVSRIEADMIVIEITDKHTGMLFKRALPVHYLETANGVVLSGENLEGRSVQIALYSEDALTRLQDLFGKGPDAPRCDHS